MGEKRQRSRNRKAILASHPGCVYCLDHATTVEHMPPTGMFLRKQRLSGLEFPSCRRCNEGSRGSDAAAAFFARLSPEHVAPRTELEEAYNLISAIKRNAPGALEEIFDRRKTSRIWARENSMMTPKVQIKLDGPIVHALMTTFTAKLGMALFAEHAGLPMPEGAGVYTQFYFNAGITKEVAETNLSILPVFGQLKQGKKTSGRQFWYRYNTDDKTILAAFAGFHDKLFVRAIATTRVNDYRFLLEEYNSGFVPFGGISEMAEKWA